jgi:hypothetical protein
MTREDLITKTAELEATLKANEAAQAQLTKELNEAKEQLENINKPKLTSQQNDLIYEAIEIAVENYDFSNTDLYDFEFNIDYNGRVYIDNMQFNDYSGLATEIDEHVTNLFNIQKPTNND